ncbi:OLC1v1012356C1 [Oldenlandia corymbosa var. corymbosa]|uniref:OLC1v1012356C1 n=1 Tax=Oldenlandia corymbosa var. corymbosa TaxID=529605 RepID=A0AAV1DVW2_OLDCO|nr:OLC1v1012356C1 [Oldenlandia corymbosa var. corymbosa]
MSTVGCRFLPTEEELVSYYLKKMILGQQFMKEEEELFVVKDLYGDEATPWKLLSDDLPWQKVVNSWNKVVVSQEILYVFSVLSNAGKKTGKNCKKKIRKAGCGTWCSNSTKPIMDSSGRKIGESRQFTFESPEQTVGHWIMTEYSIDAAAFGLPEVGEINYSDYVLCRIKRDDSISSKGGIIDKWKRRNDDMLADGEGLTFRKKMKSLSSCEDLSVVTCCDDNGAINVYNEKGAWISGDNGLPFLKK